MLMSPSTATLLGVIGMALLAISWFGRNKSMTRIAQLAWVFVGLYFFNDSFRYLIAKNAFFAFLYLVPMVR